MDKANNSFVCVTFGLPRSGIAFFPVAIINCLVPVLVFATQLQLTSQADQISGRMGGILTGYVSGETQFRTQLNIATMAKSLRYDPLRKARIHTTLSNLDKQPSYITRGAKEVKLYAEVSPGVVLILNEEGLGSGTIISGDGSILTNWHVVAGLETVAVAFKPKVEGDIVTRKDLVRADVIRVDEIADLALIKAKSVPSHAVSVELGRPENLVVGADVHAIGHPTGEAWTYTKGFISQIRKEYSWQASDGRVHTANVIQTQTPINPGNSGGPLLDERGALVGVNSFKAAGEGLNFAVSVEEASRFLTSKKSRFFEKRNVTSTQSTSNRCSPSELGRGRSQSSDAEIVLIDLNCDGVADANLIMPDDTTMPFELVADTNGDDKIDTIVLDKDRDFKWDISYYDVNGDGAPDLVGYHPDGAILASRFAPYTG